MKSRNIILLVILVLGAAGVIYIVKTDPFTSMSSSMKGMLPGTSERIDRIKVISAVDTLNIIRTGSNWSFEEGEVLNKETIESLLFTASNLHLVSIVSAEEIAKQSDFIKLQFYQSKRLEASFIYVVYKDRSVLYTEGSEQAYLVELPGYDERSIRKVFSLNRDHYREQLLLNLLPSEIRKVEVLPLTGSAFSVTQDVNAIVKVKDARQVDVPFEDRRIRLLLSYFNALRFEEVLSDEKEAVGFDASKPAASFSVETFAGERHRFRIYTWIRPGSGEADLFKALVLHNEKPQILLVNYTYLDLLIRGLEVYQSAQ